MTDGAGSLLCQPLHPISPAMSHSWSICNNSRCTGWFENIAPHLLRIQCPRRSCEIRPWTLAHVFYESLPTRFRMFFPFFYRHIYIYIYIGIFLYLGLEIKKKSGEKTKTKKSSTAWQGLIEHMCKQSGSTCISKKRSGHLEPCANTHVYLRSNCLVMTWFQYAITF